MISLVGGSLIFNKKQQDLIREVKLKEVSSKHSLMVIERTKCHSWLFHCDSSSTIKIKVDRFDFDFRTPKSQSEKVPINWTNFFE
jgi:hypothetical protein